MALDKTEIKKIALLANLPVTEDEADKYSSELSKIVEYIDKLNTADTSNSKPLFNVTLNTNIEQEDKVSTYLTQGKSLSNSPNKKDGYFVTKGVFSE